MINPMTLARRPVLQLCFLLSSTTVLFAQSPFTLEQVLSSPFPTGLVAAAHGSRVAWVFNAKGVRNVWAADGPDFSHTARQVTHYAADDGRRSPVCDSLLTANPSCMRSATN
jgi:hypothetical protein